MPLIWQGVFEIFKKYLPRFTSKFDHIIIFEIPIPFSIQIKFWCDTRQADTFFNIFRTPRRWVEEDCSSNYRVHKKQGHLILNPLHCICLGQRPMPSFSCFDKLGNCPSLVKVILLEIGPRPYDKEENFYNFFDKQ